MGNALKDVDILVDLVGGGNRYPNSRRIAPITAR